MSAVRAQLRLAKYSGAGNDFLILDERHEPGITDASAQARALCRRGASVGADGLIVLSTSDADAAAGAVARMRLWNADGSAAAFSGNAARCAVRYLVDERLAEGPDVLLQTDIGIVRGQVEGRLARVAIPGTASVYPQRRLRVEGKDLIGTYVLVGVPFFVLLHDDPDALPVRYLGRAIRTHPDLAPAGANVDFVRVDEEQALYFRVYERGVESETLSSGTGSISAALAAAAAGRVESPVACTARGGTLKVSFRRLTDAEAAAIMEQQEEAGDEAEAPEPPAGTASDPATAEDPAAAADPAAAGATAASEAAAGSVEAAADGTTAAAPPLPKVADGVPVLFGDIQLEGETRRVMEATAFAEALQLR